MMTEFKFRLASIARDCAEAAIYVGEEDIAYLFICIQACIIDGSIKEFADHCDVFAQMRVKELDKQIAELEKK
jgi:hypothetical protein